jgi:hypothetical protein
LGEREREEERERGREGGRRREERGEGECTVGKNMRREGKNETEVRGE